MVTCCFKLICLAGRRIPWVVLGLALIAATPSAQSADLARTAIDATVGGVTLRVTSPPGQTFGVTALEPLYRLHDLSGDGLQALAVYLSPDTAQFFANSGLGLPPQGLVSTLVVTERGLDTQYVDEHALRDVLADELKQQRQLQAFLASERFGPQGLRVALPETRLLAVEDFMVIEAKERLLPESGRRISYCVEAFLGLRNRAVLASSCLTKPEVSRQDMYVLETSFSAWAKGLLADNPPSRSAAPVKDGALRPTADGQRSSRADHRLATMNLHSATEHRRQDVLVASALLWAQLPADMRAGLDQSNERFGRNVGATCGPARDKALAYQCELIALERRLRALEQCSGGSIAPALEAESVEALPLEALPKT